MSKERCLAQSLRQQHPHQRQYRCGEEESDTKEDGAEENENDVDEDRDANDEDSDDANKTDGIHTLVMR